MKVFASAVLAVAVIAVGVWAILGENMQTTSFKEFTTPFARTDPAH